ncbi:MAG: hypothetical protein ACI9S8_001381 [Chlamydiales bacterium]
MIKKTAVFIFLFIAVLLPFSMSALVELSVDSRLLDYDGKRIKLEGDVLLEHDLGKISAESALLQRDRRHSESSLRTFRLNDNVSFDMKDGGSLLCGDAEIDYDALTANFSGHQPYERVTYTDSYQGDKNEEVTIKVESKHIGMNLARQGKVHTIDNVTAREGVILQYGDVYTAFSDEALFQRKLTNQENSLNPGFCGEVTLRPWGKKGVCKVVHRAGDFIDAGKIRFDGREETLYCEGACGTVCSHKKGLKASAIHFQSGFVQWKEKSGILKLSDQVTIDQDLVGRRIEAEDEVILWCETASAGNFVNEIQSSGRTTITYSGDAGEHKQRLFCSGGIHLNQIAMKTLLYSANTNGKILEDQQVVFQDNLGEIHGDTVFIDYESVGEKIQPVKMRVIGNVKVMNRSERDLGMGKVSTQYAVADEAVIFFHPHEMTLSSWEHNDVLYFDKVKNMQMSASKIVAKRDGFTGKDSIEGIGAVHFLFDESELARLTKAFHIGGS